MSYYYIVSGVSQTLTWGSQVLVCRTLGNTQPDQTHLVPVSASGSSRLHWWGTGTWVLWGALDRTATAPVQPKHITFLRQNASQCIKRTKFLCISGLLSSSSLTKSPEDTLSRSVEHGGLEKEGPVFSIPTPLPRSSTRGPGSLV